MERKEKRDRVSKRALWVNLLIIIAVAFIGVWIAYLALAIFTKHGEEVKVPKVENMTYTKAIELLHSQGFNVDIRDSLFREDIKPGYVIEQFPKANSIVKPGRKIFLYINAVHPKEVVIDDGGDRAALALKDWSFRQVKSRLIELGFKNIGKITVLGSDDRVVKITADGKPVFKMQKIPINARIIIEVSDGRLGAVRDSLYEVEKHGSALINYFEETQRESRPAEVQSEGTEQDVEDEPEYFEAPEPAPSSTPASSDE